MKIYKIITSKSSIHFNSAIKTGFLKHQGNIDIKKTHLFGGRYENIYLTEQHIPELKILLQEAIKLAENILNTEGMRAGYWFNYMPPESSTMLHSHDDDDELLSAVYYVHTPKDSGDLILYEDRSGASANKIAIKPEAGQFIFFKPDVRHEVTKNNSSEHRLSIGINFGLNPK